METSLLPLITEVKINLRGYEHDDGGMATPHSKDSLEVLNKGDLDFSQLIDHAASVLRIDLASKSEWSFEYPDEETSTDDYTFREQWVLRWLVRRFTSDQSLQSNNYDTGETARKPWMLLLHLLHAIPQKASTEILAERNFLQCLDRQIRLPQRTSSTLSAHSNAQVNGYGIVETAAERPSKRRRLSPEPGFPPEDRASHEYICVVFRVCCRFADIVVSQSAIGNYNEHITGLAWTSSELENAKAFAASLHVAATYLVSMPSDREGPASFSQIQKLLAFWECRPAAVSDVTKAKEIAAFNTSCLAPCLELLDICTKLSRSNVGAKACAQKFEKLLALHTVLPLRSRFNSQQSKQWKKNRPCLSWDDIKPIYEDTADILAPQKQACDERMADMLYADWRPWSPHLYSIAIRLISKSDHRRKQWEQPWLDALFVSLCYCSLPALHKLEFSSPDVLRPLGTLQRANDQHGLEAISRLVEVAIEQHVSISLQVSSYIASALLSGDTSQLPWKLLSNIVTLDVNAFIPGLGVPTTDYATIRLLSSLQGRICTESDYSTLREGIVLPLISGFARARALREMIETWRPQLMLAIQLEPLQGGLSHALAVWDDEDIYDKFSEVAAQHATPALAQEVFTKTLQSLGGLDGSPATFDAIADVTVCTACVQARDVGDASSGKLQDLQDAAIAVLSNQRYHTDYHHDHRWRLWKLVYCIQEMQSPAHLATNVLAVTCEGNVSLSLHSLTTEDTASLGPSQLRERLERSSILFQQALKGNRPFLDILNTEIDALQNLTSTLRQDEALWNGRMARLDSTGKLVSACLGTLVSQSKVLGWYPELVLILLQKLKEDRRHESYPNQATQVIPRVRDLILTLIWSVQGNGTREVTEKLNLALLEAVADTEVDSARMDLIRYLCIESISKASARTVASDVFDRLTDRSHEMSLARLAEYLALMDRLAAHCSVSFCQGKAWSTWVKILNTLEKRNLKDDLNHASTMMRCINSMLRKVVISLVDEGLKVQSDVLSPVLESCKAMTKSLSVTEYRVSRVLALRACISVLCESHVKLAEPLSKSLSKLVREHVQRLSGAVIKILGSTSELSELEYWRLTELLQALNEVGMMSAAPEDLINFVQSSELASHGSFISQADDPGSFPGYQIAFSALLRRYLDQQNSKRGESPVSKVAIKTSLADPNKRSTMLDQQQLSSVISRANNVVQTLSLEGHAELLEILALDDHKDERGMVRPCMVAAVILHADTSRVSDSPRLIRHFASVAGLSGCYKLTDQTIALLALENAKLTFDLHSKIINQATIDSLLGNMSLMLSRSSTVDLHHANTDAIFDRIIAILGSLLSRFRRRLSDRHHLLLPVLQQLLRCLFYSGPTTQHSVRQPAQGSNPAAFLKSLPTWLCTSVHSLAPSSAEKYTRIISSICNPTVSAAKSSSSRKRAGAGNELTDETKRVKILAGEHMQYLVMEYCRCTLDGEIAPGVKQKLMPGVFTVLDSMSRDLMRGMNAAMDPSSKAIFKGLYDDWVRYGKWDRS